MKIDDLLDRAKAKNARTSSASRAAPPVALNAYDRSAPRTLIERYRRINA